MYHRLSKRKINEVMVRMQENKKQTGRLLETMRETIQGKR